MKKSKDLTEEILMKNKSLDELIKLKMQEELKNAFNTRVGNNSKTLITDIKDVPVDKIFTKRATFKVFNKKLFISFFLVIFFVLTKCFL